MKIQIEQSIAHCIEAINNSGTGSDTKVLETIRAVTNQPYQGHGLGIGSYGERGYRTSRKDMFKRFEDRDTITDSLTWLNAILYLYDSIGFNEDEILASAADIRDDIIFNHVLKHIITNLAIRNEIEKALQFIPNFRPTKIFTEENNLDKGYLIILGYFASQGDAENFFKYFRLAEPAKNRHEVAEAKKFLVESFATKNEIEASINLCRHKNLGDQFIYDALYAIARQGQYLKAKEIFEKYPALKQPEQETELRILSTAYLEAKTQKIETEDVFDELFERALKVDKKLKWGDFRLQDSILLDLGMANLENRERVNTCRKAIKNSGLKRELG